MLGSILGLPKTLDPNANEYYRYPFVLRQAHVAVLLLLDEGTSVWFRVSGFRRIAVCQVQCSAYSRIPIKTRPPATKQVTILNEFDKGSTN